MKKSLSTLVIIYFIFLVSVSGVNAQTATESATASDSASTKGGTSDATESADASGSGSVVLPETLPVSGSYDIFFLFTMGLVLIGAGFSGLVYRKTIVEDFEN